MRDSYLSEFLTKSQTLILLGAI